MAENQQHLAFNWLFGAPENHLTCRCFVTLTIRSTLGDFRDGESVYETRFWGDGTSRILFPLRAWKMNMIAKCRYCKSQVAWRLLLRSRQRRRRRASWHKEIVTVFSQGGQLKMFKPFCQHLWDEFRTQFQEWRMYLRDDWDSRGFGWGFGWYPEADWMFDSWVERHPPWSSTSIIKAFGLLGFWAKGYIITSLWGYAKGSSVSARCRFQPQVHNFSGVCLLWPYWSNKRTG